MLDKATAISTANRYANEIKKQYNPFAIVLFGSYISGSPHEDSDIDIAVVFNGFNGDWYDTSVNLWRISCNVSLDIEPHLLDITKDLSGFVQHILKTGEFIYKTA